MSQTTDAAINEMFEYYTTTDELKREFKYFVKAVNEAKNKQAARVYGKNKYFIQSVVKLQLQQSEMPKVEYYARGFDSNTEGLEA